MSTVWFSLRGFLQRALEMLDALGDDVEPPAPQTPEDFARIYERLSAAELHAQSDELTEADLLADLSGGRREPRFLGFYSEGGGLLALRRYGFVQLLENKGIDPVFSVDTTDPATHRLIIYDGVESDDTLIIELAAGFRELCIPGPVTCKMLFIDWLCMQDPRKRLECDGLMNHPAHFHNAFLYGKAMDFADPAHEGWFQALSRDLEGLELGEATRAVDQGRVLDQDGEVVRWRGLPQVVPITLRLQTWLDSREYKDAVMAARACHSFTVIDG